MNRKSVLWVWIASFFLVLFLPLLGTLVVYWKMRTITQENTEKFNSIAIIQIEAGVERMVTSLGATGRRILNMPEVVSLSFAEQPLNVFKRERIGAIHAKLLEYIVYSDFIENIYVRFTRMGVTASTEGMYENDSLITHLSSALNVNTNDLSAWVESNKYFQMRMLSSAPAVAPFANKILVIIHYSAPNSIPDTTCIFVINAERLREILAERPDSLPGETWYLWAVSPDDGLVVCQEKAEAYTAGLGVNFHSKAADEYQAVLSAQNMAVTVTASSTTPWLLVSAIPMNEYSSQINVVQNIYILFFVICVTIGILISLALAYRLYKPVRHMAQVFLNLPAWNPEKTGHGQKNEFDYLEDSLSNLIKEKQQYETEIDRQRPLLIQSNLIKMLLGTFHDEKAFAAACRDYGFSFSSDRYLVVCAGIKEYARQDKDTSSGSDGMEHIRLTVCSVLEEQFRKYGDCYGCFYDGYVFCVVSPNGSNDAEFFVRRVKELCAEADIQFRRQLKIGTSAIYVSSLYGGHKQGAKDIHEAYLEARWGMEQIEGFLFTDNVMSSADIVRNAQGHADTGVLFFPRYRRKYLSNAVSTGDIETADGLFALMLKEGIARLDPSFSNMRLHGLFLLDDLLSNLDAAQQEQCREELLTLMKPLREARKMDELRQLMHKAFIVVHKACLKPEKGLAVLVTTEIKQYIDENYIDRNLSVFSIAEHFNFSQSYLLRIFKKGEHRGVLEYIHWRRINEAKALLKNSAGTVSDIAIKVGYTSALTLIRTFKRLEGITPTAYRTVNIQ